MFRFATLLSNFEEDLKRVVDQQKVYFQRVQPNHKPSYFSEALSPEDVAIYMNDDSFMVGSFMPCVSIVFANWPKIYKMPMTTNAMVTLQWLMRLYNSTAQVLLPEDEKKFYI